MKSCRSLKAAVLLFAFGGLAASAQSAGVSYGEIAPILHQHCANCHSPAGGAPFTLQSYADAKQWSGQILDVTQSRYMPPWLPAPGRGDFAGDRRLSDAELAAIRAWVGAGAPPGNAEQTRPANPGPDWPLGPPSATLESETPIQVPASGPDLFLTIALPVKVQRAERLRAIEIRPSDPATVRSVTLSFGHDTGAPSATGMELPRAAEEGSAGLVFWAPGLGTLRPQPGQAWSVTPQTTLLLTMHLKTTGKSTDLKFRVGLYSAPAGSSGGSARVMRLEHAGAIDIPAGASSTVLEDTQTLAKPTVITAIYPRAHFLAQSFDVYATTPAGKQVWLLSIPRWDVDWVEAYRYRKPLLLPKGSVVHWKVVYNNSAENPHNPSDPPAEVHAGPTAKDEADAILLETSGAASTSRAKHR